MEWYYTKYLPLVSLNPVRIINSVPSYQILEVLAKRINF